MEPQWNPMMEEQALCRVYRMGQKKDVTIVRYRMRDSFENVCLRFPAFRSLVIKTKTCLIYSVIQKLIIICVIESCLDPRPEERRCKSNLLPGKFIGSRRRCQAATILSQRSWVKGFNLMAWIKFEPSC
jgi:hypothetical protein